MRITILILLITLSLSSFSQYYVDSTFYSNGKLQSFGNYDSLHKYWRHYRFYETGQGESTRRLDPIHFCDTDTSMIYHRNGKLAWIFPYVDSGFLTGKLIGYYQDGSIKREAYYYRSFRTGTWKEYYKSGKLKAVSSYQITHSDSFFSRKLTFEDRISGLATTEKFTWDEIDSIVNHERFYSGNRSLETTSLISKETDVWETYDISGKLENNKQLKNFKSTVIARQLMEKEGLSLETVKEIYERANSFDDLAQLFEDNIEGDKKTELLKTWREAQVDFLEMLNKPRLALGLEKLIFKEELIQTH